MGIGNLNLQKPYVPMATFGDITSSGVWLMCLVGFRIFMWEYDGALFLIGTFSTGNLLLFWWLGLPWCNCRTFKERYIYIYWWGLRQRRVTLTSKKLNCKCDLGLSFIHLGDPGFWVLGNAVSASPHPDHDRSRWLSWGSVWSTAVTPAQMGEFLGVF